MQSAWLVAVDGASAVGMPVDDGRGMAVAITGARSGVVRVMVGGLSPRRFYRLEGRRGVFVRTDDAGYATLEVRHGDAGVLILLRVV